MYLEAVLRYLHNYTLGESAVNLTNQAQAIVGVDYATSPAINQSCLKHILRSPSHFFERLRNPPKPTPAMVFGSNAHKAILEPDVFRADFVKAPAFRRTKEGKAAKVAFETENALKTIVSAEDYESIAHMVESVYSHPEAYRLLTSGTPESPIFGELEGVQCKGRPDFVRDTKLVVTTEDGVEQDVTGHIVVDLKTTHDASPSAMSRTIVKLGYDFQAAFYCDLLTAARKTPHDLFVIIAVETEPPYAVAVYALDFGTIELGRAKYKRALSIYKQCLETKIWPGYGDDIMSLAAPSWAFQEVQYE